MLFLGNRKRGIVNVKMIITEEKILSNIDKVEKLINPNSKKQIIQLEDDAYFKDLIDSIKVYLIEYPNKKNFPGSVYNAAHKLVEYATDQFEENTKQVEVLIRQRENNINVANELKLVLESVQNARINNLETNLHIEIDMERIEDRSKALSYIGIEIAEALRGIPTPVYDPKQEKAVKEAEVKETVKAKEETLEEFIEETRFEVKPSLWERVKQSKLVQAIKRLTRIRIVIDVPALPEGRGK